MFCRKRELRIGEKVLGLMVNVIMRICCKCIFYVLQERRVADSTVQRSKIVSCHASGPLKPLFISEHPQKALVFIVIKLTR